MPSRNRSEATLSGEINLRRDQTGGGSLAEERRAKPRLRKPFATTVTGTDLGGRAFQVETELANMSSSGLFLRMPYQVDIGQELNLMIQFSDEISGGATARVLGRVLRTENGMGGLNGFGVAITNYEFV